MSLKERVIKQITNDKIVAVVRAEEFEEAKKIVESCVEGGVNVIEITFTIPKAHHILEKLVNKFSDKEIVIGAGTVLDSETARIAILSGAQFIVSPYFDEETAKTVNRYSIPYLPGAMTIKEIIECLEYGADIIKWFPGELTGPQGVKAIKGPLPHVKLMPTGGVNIDNVQDWISAGAVAVGVGGSLTGSSKNSDYHSITEKSKEFIEKVKGNMS